MSLPQGRFWAFRYDDESPIYIRLDEPMSPGQAFQGAEHFYDHDWFLHIFGIVPEPGEALLLDTAKEWCGHCPQCAVPLEWVDDPYERGFYRNGCSCKDVAEDDWPFHTPVIGRKPLKAVGPEHVEGGK